MSPWLAVKPASGRITSLGSGGKRFSRAMARPAPGAPRVSIMLVAQPAIPPVGCCAAATVRIMGTTLSKGRTTVPRGSPCTAPEGERGAGARKTAVRAAPLRRPA
ncbi:hypothetical protein GCM10010405_32200 [Streptomyces macrosporus]|uniref:Uncharacterized protein n=1 Tax=Streptomyces macrosporus TaxID=44032 RepID=A0ABN3K480_9ACTN